MIWASAVSQLFYRDNQTQWDHLWKVQIELIFKEDQFPWLRGACSIHDGHPLLSRCLCGRGFPSCHLGRKVPYHYVGCLSVGRFLFLLLWQWGLGESLSTPLKLIEKGEMCKKSLQDSVVQRSMGMETNYCCHQFCASGGGCGGLFLIHISLWADPHPSSVSSQKSFKICNVNTVLGSCSYSSALLFGHGS